MHQKMAVATVSMASRCSNTKFLDVVSCKAYKLRLSEFRLYVCRYLLEINGPACYNQDAAIPKGAFPKRGD